MLNRAKLYFDHHDSYLKVGPYSARQIGDLRCEPGYTVETHEQEMMKSPMGSRDWAHGISMKKTVPDAGGRSVSEPDRRKTPCFFLPGSTGSVLLSGVSAGRV